jgi:hypothetical protein
MHRTSRGARGKLHPFQIPDELPRGDHVRRFDADQAIRSAGKYVISHRAESEMMQLLWLGMLKVLRFRDAFRLSIADKKDCPVVTSPSSAHQSLVLTRWQNDAEAARL